MKNYPRLQFFIMKNDEKVNNPKTDEELTRDFDKLWNYEPTQKRIVSYNDALSIYLEDYKRDYVAEYCFGKIAILSENDENIQKVEQHPNFIRWITDSEVSKGFNINNNL
jgi:hypothetical protein